MVRMKLEGFDNIAALEFDLAGRKVNVFHTGDPEPILEALGGLGLGCTVEASGIAETAPVDHHREQRTLLWQVLVINFFFFALEMLTGFISDSMGLVADSLDMLADSLVYGLALFAVGGTAARKKNIAKASGYFQIVLAVFGFVEVIRRFLGYGEVPAFGMMIVISILALIGNAICLYLLQKSKSDEVHMQASMIFTSNDVIINLGVIGAGILVYLTDSKIPDLAVGAIVFAIVARGAYRILGLSR